VPVLLCVNIFIYLWIWLRVLHINPFFQIGYRIIVIYFLYTLHALSQFLFLNLISIFLFHFSLFFTFLLLYF